MQMCEYLTTIRVSSNVCETTEDNNFKHDGQNKYTSGIKGATEF